METKHPKIMLRIVILFVTVMLMSFVPENFRDLFGDVYCKIPNHFYGGDYHEYPEWHWGFRHFAWCVMGITLFIYNAVLLIREFD